MLPLPFPIARFLRGSSHLVLSSMYGEVCGRSVRELLFFLGLPTVHTVHGWSSRHRSLALVMRCCQQMTEYMICILPPSLPFRPPVCGPGCWRKLLLRCFEYRNLSVSSWGRPTQLRVQEWVRDFPSLLPIFHKLPKEYCLVLYGCAIGICSSGVRIGREDVPALVYPKWVVL